MPEQCGCRVDETEGTAPHKQGAPIIVQCNLHARAAEMRELLQLWREGPQKGDVQSRWAFSQKLLMDTIALLEATHA